MIPLDGTGPNQACCRTTASAVASPRSRCRRFGSHPPGAEPWTAPPDVVGAVALSEPAVIHRALVFHRLNKVDSVGAQGCWRRSSAPCGATSLRAFTAIAHHLNPICSTNSSGWRSGLALRWRWRRIYQRPGGDLGSPVVLRRRCPPRGCGFPLRPNSGPGGGGGGARPDLMQVAGRHRRRARCWLPSGGQWLAERLAMSMRNVARQSRRIIGGCGGAGASVLAAA